MSRIFAVLVLVGFVGGGFCADAKGNRFRKRQDEKKIKAVVEKIEGTVDVKPPKPQDQEEDSEWRAAKENDELDEGFEVATGVKSKAYITLVFPNDKTGKVIIADLSNVVISDLKEAVGDKPVQIKTEMKFGKMKIDVKDTGVKFDWKIKTPNATTAITGTDLVVTSNIQAHENDRERSDTVRVSDGEVHVQTSSGNDILITNGGGGGGGGAGGGTSGTDVTGTTSETTTTTTDESGNTTTTTESTTTDTSSTMMSDTTINESTESTSLPSGTTSQESTTSTSTDTNNVNDPTFSGTSSGNLTQGTSPTNEQSVEQQQSLQPLPSPPGTP